MEKYTLVADSGIHITTFPVHLNFETSGCDKDELLFKESIGQTELKLDLLKEISFEEEDYSAKYLYGELESGGFFAPGYTPRLEDIAAEGIMAIPEEDDGEDYNPIFKADWKTLEKYIHKFENQWLPIPYFRKLGDYGFDEGAYNWARMKLVPIKGTNSVKSHPSYDYQVILAFDTRIHLAEDPNKEGPSFPDNTGRDIIYGLCTDKLMLMDYCAYNRQPNYYIYNYLFSIVYPKCLGLHQVHENNKLEFIANFIFLLDCLGKKSLLPTVTLHRDGGQCGVDLVVDIGNSRTMAVLVEDGRFEDSKRLELLNYTQLVSEDGELLTTDDSFDMRVAFRKVDFGAPMIGSQQFSYPSLVRLGEEANYLMYHANLLNNDTVSLSSNSSPKRYLWDDKPSLTPWGFMVLEGESDNTAISIKGITDQLQDDGRLIKDQSLFGGIQKLYSRQSLMTFAFLEILTQLRRQINSHTYRDSKANKTAKRVIKRLVVTCPTAWSKTERDALVRCAQEAAELLRRFYNEEKPTEVVPVMPSRRDADSYWYYDEATCSQLVYMYGEIYKYKSNLDVLFDLWGKKNANGRQTITIGSLDIGAGTSDLMIGEYSYTQEHGLATITPDPKYYDSFYYAGDDMLQNLIQNVLYLDEESAIKKSLPNLSRNEYLQLLRDLFGKDWPGQTEQDRVFRRSFNLQYAVPLMSHFLKLSETGSSHREVSYEDVFKKLKPNKWIQDTFFEKTGVRLDSLVWTFNPEVVDGHIFREFEPLLKMVATIMNNSTPKCDVVLISGRPASLPAVRNVLLKYYPTSPDRIILVNNHYVGRWYPFSRNTGYVDDPKTIVAVGALVGLYGAKLNKLNDIKIDLSLLNTNLHSTINYVLKPNNETECVLSPEKTEGGFLVPHLPAVLKVRQLDVDSYLSRPLYVIDYNKHKMANAVCKEALLNNQTLLPNEIRNKVQAKIDKLQMSAPYSIILNRDTDDKEKIEIVSITNSKGEDQKVNNVEIHTQSMGIDEEYWLDTGAFEF